jgi:peptide deformylase
MAIREILLLGNPVLYERSEECTRSEDLNRIAQDLQDTMLEFRKKHGFGRAIAAPQIGERKRMIFMFIHEPVVFINPVLKPAGEPDRTVWDDCMSFPGLLVKVKRYSVVTFAYYDLKWQKHSVVFRDDLSELIQHEYDHLDGILAVQRAVDSRSFALASQRKWLKIKRSD